MRDLQKDIESIPGSWTQAQIDALKQKHSRTHFDHFRGLQLKPQRRLKIKGVWYVWKFGKWRRMETK
jgi:hypothetical protein